jgi:hypothetical protein
MKCKSRRFEVLLLVRFNKGFPFASGRVYPGRIHLAAEVRPAKTKPVGAIITPRAPQTLSPKAVTVAPENGPREQ